jgi:hypothetical protein
MAEDRRPWNPFPLHSLGIKGLSACAKSVLIYLAARSNHKGETCVGHRRMCEDLVRSKDFVNRGLNELYEKGFVIKSQRNRHKHQADWRTLNASLILPISLRQEKSKTDNQSETSMSETDFEKSETDRQGETFSFNLSDSNSNLLKQMNEGMNEGNPLATLGGNDSPPEDAKPWGDRDLMPVWQAWLDIVPLSNWSHDDKLAARHVVDEYGEESVLGYLRDTSLCPKTRRITWMDFKFWAVGMKPKGRTKRNIDAWRRNQAAKEEEAMMAAMGRSGL